MLFDSFLDEMQKISVVRGSKKQYRRALEAFERHRRGLPGSKDWQAVRGDKHLSGALAAAELRPGKVNKASPMTSSGETVQEVYFGRGHPASPWYDVGRGSRAIGVDHERLMGLNMPQSATLAKFLDEYKGEPEVRDYFARLFSKPRLTFRSGGTFSSTNPDKWVQAPGKVPLKPKDIAVAPKGTLSKADKEAIRRLRLRYIPTKTLDRAARQIPTYKVPRELPIDIDQLKKQAE